MRYVTGIYALNLPSLDGTPGDWHFSALDWRKARIADSADSPFGDWGIRTADVPHHGRMPAANHVRACLDLIEQGNYGTARGMRDIFINDDSYASLIFSKVSALKGSPRWEEIDSFMGMEYLCQWLDFKESLGLMSPKRYRESLGLAA